MRVVTLFLLCMLMETDAAAATRPHVVSFGKTTTVKWYVGSEETKAIDLKVRALYVDARLKEFTLGQPHEVTDRLFVVQRAFRLNDTLPQDKNPSPIWRWQRGGWLLVDRITGRVSTISLPEFDSYYSSATWYRDYVAYCGVSDDGKKLFLIVAQLSHRKPVLKKAAGEAKADEMPDSDCSPPVWERPARVTFAPRSDKFTYSVRGHAVDLVNDPDEEENAE